MIFLSLCFLLVSSVLVETKLNSTETGLAFQSYYVKAIILRFNDSILNHPSENQYVKNIGNTKVQIRSTPLEEAWKRYERAVKIGELDRIARNGTTNDMVIMAAREIWERTGGKLITDVAAVIGPQSGRYFGQYLGGALGIACGVFFPPLQIPLVIGGVLIGGNLGRILGFVGGQIAANVVNSMISDKIIAPILQKKLDAVLRKWLNQSAHSPDVTCRSDICKTGYAEHKCKCRSCGKGSEYSDAPGLAACKHCTPGAKPHRCRWGGSNCGCTPCNAGYFGADGSNCQLCRKDMEYTDTSGSKACKNCMLGMIPYECSRNYGHCGCVKCSKGKIGTSKGHCIECKGNMEYSDVEAATSCKNCSLGTIPRECRRNYGHCSCVKCSKGKIGTRKGQCLTCKGAMEYSDMEGATACKNCSVGSIPYECGYNYGHCGCRKCSKGKIGTDKGHCALCNGAMEYSDSEGATSCKKCSLGSISFDCGYNYGHCGCRKCSKGKFGTEKDRCALCNGAMEYSDSEGATSCKKCSLGSIPIDCGYNYGYCRCKKCGRGKFGTSKGKCMLCDGAMEYNDSEGATACKTCPQGTHPYRCTYTNGHCGCNKDKTI